MQIELVDASGQKGDRMPRKDKPVKDAWTIDLVFYLGLVVIGIFLLLSGEGPGISQKKIQEYLLIQHGKAFPPVTWIVTPEKD